MILFVDIGLYPALFALTARAEEQYVLAYPDLAAARPGSAWTTDPVIL